DAPNVVCDQFTVVPLGVDGTARVQALSFDDGSTDNCGILNYEVSRMASDCGPETDFGPHVDFSCCDLEAGPVMVALKVTDGAGKFNICMIEVTVQDKAAPVISCPPPADLDCDEDYKNLALTGLATAEDNCVVDSIYFVDDEELNNCGWGTVTRKWIARDKAGNEAECYQTITITNRNPFVSMDITWPENYTATECGASILPENLPIPNARPILDTLPCDNVVTDYHDLAIGDDGGAACYVIHREWTVTDLCVYDPNDEMSGGQWTMVQQIFIVDNTDPIFIKGNEDIDIEIDGNCVDIPYTIMADVEDCSPNLTYSYEVDLFSNGTNDYNGIGQMKELDFTAGYHEVKWTVTDGCSNEATATQTLYFKDIKAPTPVLEALFVGLMPMQDGGEVDVKARGFNSSSTDNCTEATALRFAFSEDITDTVQTFTCEDVVGPFEIDVYVFDDEENWAFATTYVDIQDQNDVCPEVMANVTGMITTPAGEEISDVTVTLEGGATDPFMTDNNGLFSFSVVPGGSYMLKPYKDVDAMNGVSTYDMVLMQRHILGLAEFSDPYTIIAADVNKSGSISTSDMVAMRRLILNINEDFGSNQSWRFVHADYDFSGDDILTQEFPEAYELNSMSGNMEIDFIGIKVGDMNASVDPSGLLGQASNDDQALEFSLENIALKAGNTYEIAFKAKDFNDIIAFQYTLEFDPSIVSVNHIASGALEITEENYNMSSADNGAIATNWYDALPVSLSDEETLFTITLSAHENIHLSDAIGLGSSMTNAESYRQSSFSNPVQTGTTLLDFYSTIKEAAFELGQNMPNPFSDVTTIEVMVPRTSKGSLAVFDLTGKILMQVDQEFSKGMNEIMITSDRLPSNGIYYYKLSVDDFTDTRKMIVIH
ncbi:MAG: T9SS type A sorting domain-containing protein, partial [Bacteroidia bacterium]|nr:T9SS type A sorting domain-containing protein [Bacteroidia bacterium]